MQIFGQKKVKLFHHITSDPSNSTTFFEDGCLLYYIPGKNFLNSIVSLVSTLWNDLTAID